MALTFREDTGAFIGVHRKLTVAEADGNVYTLHSRLAIVEGQAGKQIDRIEFTNTAATVYYTDLTIDGPYPLGVATMRYVGLWTQNAPYTYLDIVTVSSGAALSPGDAGVYMALVNHISPLEPFDPQATDDSGNLLWVPLMPQAVNTPFAVINFTGTVKTLTPADANTYVRCTNTLGATITVSSGDFEVGTEITIRQAASGTVQVVAGGGVIVNRGQPDELTHTPWKGATITLKYVGEDEWDYIGPGTELP